VSSERNGAAAVQTRVHCDERVNNAQLNATKLCRVLVVDDDPLVQALRCMEIAHFHIVLADWEMPDIDGLALCRLVRLQERESYVYILMLTIRDTEPDLLTGLGAGADDYMVKGAAVDVILARLEIGRRISHGGNARRTQNRDAWSATDTDPVTGAHSLHYLLQSLPREWIRSQRYGRCLAVLVCHIDGFARFADRFGREAGDEQLRAFVSGVGATIRRCDWLARTRDGSFMVALPETAAAAAQRVAQKLRALIAVHPFSTPADPIGFSVTVEVTSLDGKHDVHGAAQIDAMLRHAVSGAHANLEIGNEPPQGEHLTGEGDSAARRNDLN
jgi:two-component system, cell cycle response regulator